MRILDDEEPVRGVFVLLEGVKNEYTEANCWVVTDGLLSVRRKINRFGFMEFSVFGRFDQVGYMRKLP